MTAIKRNNILQALLIGAMIGVVVLTTVAISTELRYEALQTSYEELEVSTSESLILKAVEHQTALNAQIALTVETEEALSIALNQNALMKTLSTTPMGEWSVKTIMDTRKLFDSIPYGSWFEGGHNITGDFGSTALSGTYWHVDGHKGVDIVAEEGRTLGKPVLSAIDGRVKTWGRNDRVYGNYLVIETLDGLWEIKIGHLDSIAVFLADGTMDLYEGMEFKRGDRIAKAGNSGKSTNPHLHVEYHMKTDEGQKLLNANLIMEYMGE